LAAKKKDQESERRERLAAIAKVADRFSGFKPAGEVLTKVRAVPTNFVQLNVATRVGGWPIERIGLVHGPSGYGKTSFALGLGLSFLERGHFFAYVDAEYTTPQTWLSQLMAEQAINPAFVAKRPKTYEETRDSVKQFAETIGQAKDKGDLDSETTALIVVDSLRKLVPNRMAEALEKEAEKVGLDGMRGMGGAYRAALNSAWFDELIPLLFHTGTALVVVARERKKMNAQPFETQYEIGGGESVIYDSSLICRITREFVKEGEEITGERHLVRISKSKVGGRDGKYTDAHFSTSLGITSPAGFDRARDVLEMALSCGVVEKKAGKHWVTTDAGPLGAGEVFGNSEAEALKYMRANPAANQAIEEQATAKFNPPEGEEAA